MPREIWQATLEKFLTHVDLIELSGLGEPTMAPDFLKYLEDIKSIGKAVKFPTNCHFLEQLGLIERVRETAEDATIELSVDAATEGTYKKIRKGGDFGKVISNIKLLKKMMPNAKLYSTFVAMDTNIDEFPAYVRMMGDLGVAAKDGPEGQLVFKPVDCWVLPREKYSLRFQKNRTMKALGEARKIADTMGVNLKVIFPEWGCAEEDNARTPSPMICESFVTTRVEPLSECGDNGYLGCKYYIAEFYVPPFISEETATDGTQTKNCVFAGASTIFHPPTSPPGSYGWTNCCNARRAGISSTPWTDTTDAWCYGKTPPSSVSKANPQSADNKWLPPCGGFKDEWEGMTPFERPFIVQPNGDICACLGGHKIGNALTMGWYEFIADKRIQEFWTHCVRGEWDEWCKTCDRLG
jgi:hypothetical protein